ncbi:MAG: hypothetical protein HND57_04515 [Planctomycetes bacterium]|nr:hypothetical protein [Planctomycetota bacterium]
MPAPPPTRSSTRHPSNRPPPPLPTHRTIRPLPPAPEQTQPDADPDTAAVDTNDDPAQKSSENTLPAGNTVSNADPDKPGRFIPAPGKEVAETGDGEAAAWHLPDGTLQTLGATGAVLGLILLGATWLKRSNRSLATGGRAVSGLVDVLARYPFGRNQSLALIKIDRRILVLCQGAQETTLITEITDPEEVVSILRQCRDDQGESFDRRLEDILRQSDAGRSEDVTGPWADSSDSGHDVVDLTRSPRRRNHRAVTQATGQGVVG